MLAKLHDKPFNDPNWIYEIKWDGYRAIAEINKKEIRLYSRNGLSFRQDYPVVYDELKKIKKDTIIDGEIVAVDSEGKPGFQLLQHYGEDENVALCYYVFDCLSIGGKSIEDKPLTERKALLKALLPESDTIRYCDHVEEKGKEFFKALQKQGLEGMVAKKADGAYHENARSPEWLKVKNVLTGEAVIAGYTEPRGGRKFLGALVLGVYKSNKLTYVGHTGTGFSDSTLKEVYQKMQPLKTKVSPFDSKIAVNAPVTWIKPKLVCNLKYTEVTSSGSRRHPVFMGLRIDKPAKDVKEDEIS